MKKLIRVGGVSEKLGQSIAKTWGDVSADPDFPQPIKRGGITCWLEEEIDEFILRKIAEFRSKDQGKRTSVFKAANASVMKRTAGVAL